MEPMYSPGEPTPEILREAIPQLEEPVVFNNLLLDSNGKNIWKFLDWKLTELAEKLGHLSLPFRVGLNAKTTEPQWDFKCKVENMTINELFKNIDTSLQFNEWRYFDYKYMHEWFNDYPEILSSIDWQRFGFDKQGRDSTLWIGSQGAHTNCHQDSYGFNLVAQIHGRKRWLLFPPESGIVLRPTRIPYEESTVYSSHNFFCPSKDDQEFILKTKPKARMVVLEPGQVLLVPSGWWHYVESIDLSVSVNVWLPLPADHRSRLGEAIVKLLVNQIGKGRIPTSDESTLEFNETVRLIEACVERCNNAEETTSPPEKRRRRIEWSAKKFADEFSSCVKLLQVLETGELEELLSGNRNRFPDVEYEYSEAQGFGTLHKESTDSSSRQTTNCIVDALCHPIVISKAVEQVLESSRRK